MPTSTERDNILRAHFALVQREIADLEAESAGLRAQREAVVARLQPLEQQVRELTQRIYEIEMPRLGELKNELSSLAKDMGARSINTAA